jgi:chromate transporter
MNRDDPPPEVSIARLAATFCQVALASFGGGLSAWSRKVVVEDRGWMTDEEFLSAMTLCRVLPGANQVNLAIYVGGKLRGVRGAVAAVVGLTAVPVLIVLVLGYLYFRNGSVPATQSVLRGITAVAVAMTFSMAYKTGAKALRSVPAWALCAVSFVLSAVFRVPLPVMLAIVAPVALWWAWPARPEAPPVSRLP